MRKPNFREWVVIVCAGILGVLMIASLAFAETEIKLSYVGDKYYTSVCNTSYFWDVQTEFWNKNGGYPTTEVWNELWIIQNPALSIDSFYRVDLNNGDYRGCVSFDWTRGFKLGKEEEKADLKNNAWVKNAGAYELGVGALMTDNLVYPCAVASLRAVIALAPILSIGNSLYAYFPIGTEIQTQDDLELKVNFIIGYFSLLYRIESKGQVVSSYPVFFFETSF